jgi:hypothetical protein
VSNIWILGNTASTRRRRLSLTLLKSVAESSEMFLYLKRSKDVKKQCCLSVNLLHTSWKSKSHNSHIYPSICSGAGKGVGLAWELIFNVSSNHHLSGIQSVRQDNPPSGTHDPALSSKQDIEMRITCPSILPGIESRSIPLSPLMHVLIQPSDSTDQIIYLKPQTKP